MTCDQRIVPLTLLAQAGVSVVLAVLLWWWHGSVAATSALLGGIGRGNPEWVLAARLLTPRATDAGRVAALGLDRRVRQGRHHGPLFGVIFGLVRPIAPLAVFGGFIAAHSWCSGRCWSPARAQRSKEAMK